MIAEINKKSKNDTENFWFSMCKQKLNLNNSYILKDVCVQDLEMVVCVNNDIK